MQGSFTTLNVYFNSIPIESSMFIITKELFFSKHQQKFDVAKL